MRKRNPFIKLGKQGDSEPLGAGLVDDEERRRLHELLDRIIDQRENYAGWLAEQPANSLSALSDPEYMRVKKFADQGASFAFDAAIKLAADALGDMRAQALFRATKDPESIRFALWLRLHKVRHLIEGRPSLLGERDFPLTRILDELENLTYGEIGEIFRAPPLRPSQRHNRGKLAKLRLRALAWDRWLRVSQSKTAYETHSAIAEAFRTDWDAIRKWQVSCVKILGPNLVAYSLRRAEEGHQPGYGPLDWKQGLSFDGESYQRALREEPPSRTA